MIYIPYCYIFKGKDCGQLQPPQNGSVTGDGHLYGDSIKFACNAGYELYGSDSALCLTNGNWSAQVPQCQRKWPITYNIIENYAVST